MSMRDHIDSTIILGGLNDYLNSALSSRSVKIMLVYTCYVSMGTGLAIFRNSHGSKLNKFVEATMRVNLYDDCRVSLRWPKGKGN